MKSLFLILAFSFFALSGRSSQLLIPMDESQTNHLKSYGVAFWMLENELLIEWLLNYRGGSFLCPHLKAVEEELILKGVRYDIISDGQANAIRSQIASPEVNQEIVQLEKAPKIAVYTPKGTMPWDDAVTLALQYAGSKCQCSCRRLRGRGRAAPAHIRAAAA